MFTGLSLFAQSIFQSLGIENLIKFSFSPPLEYLLMNYSQLTTEPQVLMWMKYI